MKKPLNFITEAFTRQTGDILGDNLVGVYLHGSAVMGCFNEVKSDIDLLVVVDQALTDDVKRRYMDMVVALNECAPPKGIEMSVVRRNVLKPFLYPTPFELHFSPAHLRWYRINPADYISRMKGTDRDLAAHFTILYHRGRCLCGEAISEVFEEVKGEYYRDSIWDDVKGAEEEIQANPTYIILNLCRVLAYEKEGLILSKREGGEWGLSRLPEKVHPLLRDALADYASDEPREYDTNLAAEFSAFMKDSIASARDV